MTLTCLLVSASAVVLGGQPPMPNTYSYGKSWKQLSLRSPEEKSSPQKAQGRRSAMTIISLLLHIFFYKHRVYKHIRLRFTEILSTLLSTLQPEIWLESNFTRKFFRRGLIFMQILIFLSYFYQKLYIKYFVLFIFYKYAF